MIVAEYYMDISTNEKVLLEDAQEYALDKLGIKITPLGKAGELTTEQLECLEEITTWYFDNWILEKEYENDEENYYIVKEDM